MLPEHKLN